MSEMMQIDPRAALVEQIALCEHYRNRNLVLAQQVHELAATVEAQRLEIERLQPAPEATEETL